MFVKENPDRKKNLTATDMNELSHAMSIGEEMLVVYLTMSLFVTAHSIADEEMNSYHSKKFNILKQFESSKQTLTT